MVEPKPFDMSKSDDRKRWFREMKGYLRTEDFLNQGTDREGRRMAFAGLHDLESWLCDLSEKEGE